MTLAATLAGILGAGEGGPNLADAAAYYGIAAPLILGMLVVIRWLQDQLTKERAKNADLTERVIEANAKGSQVASELAGALRATAKATSPDG